MAKMAKQILNLEQVPATGLQHTVSIHFGRVWNKMQSSLPTETDARRNHNVLGQLYSLSYQQRWCESW